MLLRRFLGEGGMGLGEAADCRAFHLSERAEKERERQKEGEGESECGSERERKRAFVPASGVWGGRDAPS